MAATSTPSFVQLAGQKTHQTPRLNATPLPPPPPKIVYCINCTFGFLVILKLHKHISDQMSLPKLTDRSTSYFEIGSVIDSFILDNVLHILDSNFGGGGGIGKF